MSAPATRHATYQDLLALPEGTRAEIVAGEIVVAPSPTPHHQSTIGELYAELRGPFLRGRGGPGGWWLILDVDIDFSPHDVLRPDIAGWRKATLPDFPGMRPVPARPDWVCEGLSPATAARDQGSKRTVYERACVPWYWIIDPLNRTLSVLRLTAEGYLVDRVTGDVGLVRLPPFDEVELDLAEIFPPQAREG